MIALPRTNPVLAADMKVIRQPLLRTGVAASGVLLLLLFLAVHVWKDLTASVDAWYFRSTPVWLLVMAVGTLIYRREVAALERSGVSLAQRFSTLPPE